MDRILHGISTLTFHQNAQLETFTENCPPNYVHDKTDTVPSSIPSNVLHRSLEKQVANMSVECTHRNSTTEYCESFSEAETEAESDSSTIAKRLCPSRASKEKTMLKLKRRSIVKPQKNGTNISKCFTSMRPEDIKKIYLEAKKLKTFRPTNLETIFEEEPIEENSKKKFMGTKKLKRSLSCSDGLNFTKTLIKSRRSRIKKAFGKRPALKKMSLDDFINKLKDDLNRESVEEQNCCNINVELMDDLTETKQIEKSQCMSNQTNSGMKKSFLEFTPTNTEKETESTEVL